MRRPIILNLSVFLLCFSTSTPLNDVFPKYTPITSRMMVYAIGLDKDDDGSVRITLAANSTETSSKADIVSSKGETFYSALTEAEKAASKEIFLGHTSIILAGQEAAKENLAGFIDYTVKNFRMRMNIKLVTVKDGTAKEVLDLSGEDNRNILAKLDSLTDTVTTDPNDSTTTLNRVAESMINKYKDPVTVAVKVTANEDNREKELSLAGFAVYKNDKLKSFLTQDIADVYALLSGKYRVKMLTVDIHDGKKLSVDIISAKTETRFVHGEYPKADITLKIYCDIAEQFGKDGVGSEVGEELTKECKEKLKEKTEADARIFLAHTKTDNADILGIADKYSKYCPYRMRRIDSDTDIYQKTEINITVLPEITNLYEMRENRTGG